MPRIASTVRARNDSSRVSIEALPNSGLQPTHEVLMTKTTRVLLVIAIVCSAVQCCSLVIDLLHTDVTPPMASEYRADQEARTALRWMVYWFSGLGAAVVGVLIRRRYLLAGYAACVAGLYLMFLGNNAGLWSSGYEVPRTVTSFITLALLLVVAMTWRPTAVETPL